MLITIKLLFFIFILNTNAEVFYKLKVEIEPSSSYIKVDGYVEFDKEIKGGEVYIDEKTVINKTNISFKVSRYSQNLLKYEFYKKNGKDLKRFDISYTNIFNYEFKGNDEYARGIKNNKGIISEDGCFLTSESGWYPVVDGMPLRFDITVSIPDKYNVVMPGIVKEEFFKNNRRVIRYVSDAYFYDIPLVCGRWKVYKLKGKPSIYVYLVNDDNLLAEKYIDYSKMYIKMYEGMIGKYPYKKFAVIENFWETGYAFPSFTLLGSKVIRFPFIYTSSLPHEILHNWWGNGVYPDYSSGNWSEGLTTYLSDYLLSEQRGKGKDYRMNVLKKYRDYVDEDIPLVNFRERHSNETEAVGYGKSMMLFHMLRKDCGDECFIKAIRKFYRNNIFKKAGWVELKKTFEEISNKNFDDLFNYFVYSSSICVAKILKETVVLKNGSLSFDLYSDGCRLPVPFKFIYSDDEYDIKYLKIENKKHISFNLPKEISVFCLDCDFEIFRKISLNEVPATFSNIIAQKTIPVISEYNHSELKPPFFISTFSYSALSNLYVYSADKLVDFNNTFIDVSSLAFTVNGKTYNRFGYFVFFIIPDRNFYSTYALCDDKCDTFINKLIHYGKYSYIITDRSYNVVEAGVWDLKEKDNLFIFKDFKNSHFEKPLWNYVSFFDGKNLKKHSFYLSSKLKTRHPGSKELEKASKYIENEFKKAGLKPLFNNSYIQKFDAEINSNRYILSNVCGKISDSDKYILVSAHYDHIFPENGFYNPGANDNSSGVSVIIELARYFSNKKTGGIIFCTFSLEEYGRKGSEYFVKNSSFNIKAVINIDTVGRLYSNPVVILNHETSSQWKSIIRKASLLSGIDFVYGTTGITSGDQISFINARIPSIQIYDGSVDDYHKPTDTFEKLDFNGMMKIADFSAAVISELINREIDFLSSSQKISYLRKISLGIAPDFTYSGYGVRIKKINPDSLLKNSPVKEGDIITSLNNFNVKDIYDYTQALSEVKGDSITVECLCSGKKEIHIIKLK